MDFSNNPNYLKHLALNADMPAGRIALRDDIAFDFDERSRLAFEYFCFRHDELPQELDSFLNFAERKSQLLDIGALFGIFSLCFCNRRPAVRRAIALDPSPQAFEILQENRRLNPTLAIETFNIAAGSSEGEIFMRPDWMHLVAQKSYVPDAVSIKTRPVDAIVQETQVKPDVVKIDVEGFEKSVLLGMSETIDRYRPDIHIEIHPGLLRDLGETPEAVVDQLKLFGYTLYDMNRRAIDSYENLHGSCLTTYCIHKDNA